MEPKNLGRPVAKIEYIIILTKIITSNDKYSYHVMLCVYVYVHVCMHMYVHVCMYMYVHVCVHIRGGDSY